MSQRRGVKVDPEDYRDLFESSEPFPAVVNRDRYDWFLVRDVPIHTFDVPTREEYEQDPDVSEEEAKGNVERVDEAIDRIMSGKPVWPLLIDRGGMILDGYHRLAAQGELSMETIDVLEARTKQAQKLRRRAQ